MQPTTGKTSQNTVVESIAKPIIKCPGGKSRLLPAILSNLPEDFQQSVTLYVEPFIGGGAVFFRVANDYKNIQCLINDFNPDIVNLYKVVKDHPKALISILSRMKECNNQEFFNEVRELFNTRSSSNYIERIEKAARFLFLNKTCFNGLIRYNSKGGFNSPFGKYKNPLILDVENILAASELFNSKQMIAITNRDFSKTIWEIDGPGSEVFYYLDPPYDPLNTTSNFTSYTSQGFSTRDHMRLKRDLDAIDHRGGRFLLSAANTETMRNMFEDYTIVEIKAGRAINRDGNKRGKITELLIKNY